MGLGVEGYRVSPGPNSAWCSGIGNEGADRRSKTLAAFGAFFCILAAFFLIMPAREEAGLKIGTDRLPILFVVSLFCTCLASPAASALIAARRPGQGQQIVLHGFAVLLAVLYALLLHFGQDSRAHAAVQKDHHQQYHWGRHMAMLVPSTPSTGIAPRTDDSNAGSSTMAAGDTKGGAGTALAAALQGAIQGDQEGSTKGDHNAHVPLPFVLMILYSCLYIVVNLANVVCVSSAWTLCATCFTATEAKACYGRLCAGATLGQLLGSTASLAITEALVRVSAWVGGPSHIDARQGTPPALLLLSSLLLLLAAHCLKRLAALGLRHERSATRESHDSGTPHPPVLPHPRIPSIHLSSQAPPSKEDVLFRRRPMTDILSAGTPHGSHHLDLPLQQQNAHHHHRNHSGLPEAAAGFEADYKPPSLKLISGGGGKGPLASGGDVGSVATQGGFNSSTGGATPIARAGFPDVLPSTGRASLDVGLMLEPPAALASRPLKVPLYKTPFLGGYSSSGRLKKSDVKTSDSGSTPDLKKHGGGTAFRPPASSSLFLFMRSLLTTLRSLSSGYMLRVAGMLCCGAMTSSCIYFLRARLVTASPALPDAHARLSFFASINALSASLILTLQLSATERAIKTVGVRNSLCVLPTLSLVSFLLLARAPAAATVAAADVLRKVIQHSLARPTREVLFTVLPLTELSGKVILDTIAARCGDVLAAGLYSALVEKLHAGLVALAAAGVVLCVGWLTLALQLGDMFESCQQQQQQQEQDQHAAAAAEGGHDQWQLEDAAGSDGAHTKISDLNLAGGSSITSLTLIPDGVTPIGSHASKADLSPTVYDLESGSDSGTDGEAAGEATGRDTAGPAHEQRLEGTVGEKAQTDSSPSGAQNPAQAL